ncbi:ParB/RepB/Spo0J family partition protein [Salipiger thiooxidans]|uniref:ParB/RepB/Spo0J family partition protein n=1 Tax=Salipiger thiooxidans TaxID=282683 RepID=UPI001CD7B5C0|nr:ParB N-terminal domain-containing protein [Salipiger thiooxidans]MCA0849666.1 ParB N-terminal domain-containing protein [Salipiger thiooxidans]
MAEIIQSITELRVDQIVVRDRLRPVSEAGVAALTASISEMGVMKDPIHVRKVKHRGGEFLLMAGAHRLTAARQLGWETIKVTCWTCTDDFARLMEIDDNLAGAELTALDTAVFLARRKEVYERLHPEAKAQVGAGLVARRWNTADMMSVVSFATSTAEKFGMTDRHVRRMIAAGACLGPDEVRRLRSAPRPVTLKDLQDISKISETGERYHVVDCLAEGRTKNASGARKLWKAEQGEGPEPLSPADRALARLLDAWDRAPKVARDRFLEERGDQLRRELDAQSTPTPTNTVVFQPRKDAQNG